MIHNAFQMFLLSGNRCDAETWTRKQVKKVCMQLGAHINDDIFLTYCVLFFVEC